MTYNGTCLNWVIIFEVLVLAEQLPEQAFWCIQTGCFFWYICKVGKSYCIINVMGPGHFLMIFIPKNLKLLTISTSSLLMQTAVGPPSCLVKSMICTFVMLTWGRGCCLDTVLLSSFCATFHHCLRSGPLC